MNHLYEDVIYEITQFLDIPSRICWALTNKTLYNRRKVITGGICTDWQKECARLDYLEIIEMFERADWSHALIHAAIAGSTRVLKHSLLCDANITRETVRAGLAGHHVGNLELIINASNKLTLEDFWCDVIRNDGLVWIPKELLRGVYSKIQNASEARILRNCHTIATIHELQKIKVLPPRKYLEDAYFAAIVICNRVLSGEQTHTTQTKIISAAITVSIRQEISREQFAFVIRESRRSHAANDNQTITTRGTPELFAVAYKELNSSLLDFEDNPTSSSRMLIGICSASWCWLEQCSPAEEILGAAIPLCLKAVEDNNALALIWLWGYVSGRSELKKQVWEAFIGAATQNTITALSRELGPTGSFIRRLSLELRGVKK
jgi:hypothetical protein